MDLGNLIPHLRYKSQKILLVKINGSVLKINAELLTKLIGPTTTQQSAQNADLKIHTWDRRLKINYFNKDQSNVNGSAKICGGVLLAKMSTL